MAKTRTSSKGISLLSLLPAMALVSVTLVTLGVGLRHDGQVKRNLEGSLNYVRSEDTVRTLLAATLLGDVALKKLPCNSLAANIEGRFDKPTPPHEAEPPEGMEFKKVPAGNPGCHPEKKENLNSQSSFYFCLDLTDWSTKASVAIVEAKYELVNLVDDAPLTCDDFQAKTDTPAPGFTPGAKVFYHISWAGDPDAGDTSLMALNHYGTIVASALP